MVRDLERVGAEATEATDGHTNTQTDKQAVSVNIADWESLHVNRYFVMLHPSPVTLFLTLQGHIIEI